MADIKDLLNIKGVFAAGKFDDKGNLLAVEGDISEEEAAMAAKMCAANNAMAEMQTDGYTAFSGQEWTPLKGWTIAGPKFSVCVAGDTGVFVKNDEASFNEIFKALL